MGLAKLMTMILVSQELMYDMRSWSLRSQRRSKTVLMSEFIVTALQSDQQSMSILRFHWELIQVFPEYESHLKR